jgi:transposase
VIRTVGGHPLCRIGCIAVDNAGRRLWRGQCPTVPEQISILVRRHGGDDARIGIETGAMTPWLVHELRNLGLEVVCLDARHARAALKMQINKTDQNDAEGLAQIVRTGGTGLFMSSRSIATARVLFWAQGLNSSV